MVTKRHGIELQGIEVLSNLGRSVERVEQRALELIACVEPEVIRVIFSKPIDCVLYARVTTKAALLGIHAVSARLCEFVEMGVNVVDVEERYTNQSIEPLITQIDHIHML